MGSAKLYLRSRPRYVCKRKGRQPVGALCGQELGCTYCRTSRNSCTTIYMERRRLTKLRYSPKRWADPALNLSPGLSEGKLAKARSAEKRKYSPIFQEG